MAEHRNKGDVVVSIKLGGGSLSQRGWRREAGDAPLREHLAAVLLMLAQFDPRSDVLLDPMCGSGTIPIEAVCGIRTIPIAETGGWRSPKPEHGDHRNRPWRSPKPGIAITETGDGDRLSAVVRPLPDLR